MASDQIRAYVLLAVFLIVYYIVAIAVVYKFGNKWIIAAYSFPIAIFIILALSSPGEPQCNKNTYAYALAALVATIAMIAALILIIMRPRGCDSWQTIALAVIGIWFIASAFAIWLFEKSSHKVCR